MADKSILKDLPDADLLEEMRERFDYAMNEWREIRQEGAKDMRYVAGDPWDPQERNLRRDAGRPCLTLDELGQYFNQVINDVRANPRGIRFSPTGNGANDKAAEFYQDKTREIEYRSHAQTAYTTAFENAVQRSYGYCRITTKFSEDPGSRFVQDLWIEAMPNPDLVLPDPDAQPPTMADMRYCFVFETRTKKEFRREFPQAQIREFSPDLEAAAPTWIGGDKVRIAEYWTVHGTKRTLLLVRTLAGAVEVFADELEQRPSAEFIVDEREVETKEVVQYLTNGVEILKRTPWAGSYIPIAPCLGKVLYVDEGSGAKKKLMSMTRLARDPYMLYCYYRTCEAELVGMTPKFPYFAYEGQLSPNELLNLQKSLHEPIAVIQVKPMVDGAATTAPLGFPARQPYEPPIAGLEVGAEAARRAIQAAMGASPLPTQAQRHNEKSGIALRQIEATGQKGTFHFLDHYDAMIRHVGVMLEDLMDVVYDTPRDVGIRKANDTAAIVRINDPQQPDAVSTRGDYLVTVSTAPASDSTRQVASDFADSLIAKPELAQIVGPAKFAKLMALAIKLKTLGPIADEMATLIDPEQGQMDPQQAQQQLLQAQQQMQQMQAALSEAVQQLNSKAIERQTELQKTQIVADKDLKLQQMRDATSIAVAKIAASAKGGITAMEAENEALALLTEQAHEATEHERDRQHEQAMADQAHQQAMEQGAQQAALTPPAAETANGAE